jgi:hypothetical protein
MLLPTCNVGHLKYPASEELKIIRIAQQSHLPAKWALDTLGIACGTT